MKLIIPMAGRGTRVRPHSHVTPKPLLSVRGKSMVERIVETFVAVLPEPITEAVFVLGPDFGDGVRADLSSICARYSIAPHFGVQAVALGTAHAVLSAGDEHLSGDGVIAFADTLFAMAPIPTFGQSDAVVWVKEVEDPSRFGVAVREGDRIVGFVEKPTEPISNEALIGMYYIRDLGHFAREARYLMANEIKGNGEYQLTDALDRMLKDGAVFSTATVEEWLDCGTIPALLETTKIILEKEHSDTHEGTLTDSVIVPPVYVGPGAVITRSVVGPYASIEAGARIEESVVRSTVVFAGGEVSRCVLDESFVGQKAYAEGIARPVNIGDHASVGVVR